jgi:DNA polymerase III subunit alpha
MTHSNFVHLHVHTQYSLLDGGCKIHELIQHACDLRFPAIAITDHGNMFGAVDFYTKAMQKGIKPIIGYEGYVAPGSRFDKSNHGIGQAGFHIVLLAKDEQGYRNIMKLSSLAYLEGFHYKPRVDKEALREHATGIIALSACLQGEVSYYVRHNQYPQARKSVEEYQNIFGKENFYLEVHDHGIPDQKVVNKGILRLHKDLGVPLVASNDVHYISRSDAENHEALLCIQTATTLDDPNRMRMSTPEFYLKSAEEMESLFSAFPGAIRNSIEIAERCNVEIELDKIHLPYFEAPQGYTHEGYLHELCLEGLKRRCGSAPTKEYIERLEYELSVITKMGYTSYFLIVWDFVKFARDHDIPVGPGRGSAAGSLVSYALGITEVNPLKFNLIFERFLNPARVSMPDIDIDFCKDRRGEVIQYVARRYGQENVAQIITFSTMAARGAIRDVGRVLGMSFMDVDKIAKLVPEELGITLDRALKIEPRFKEQMNADPKIAKLLHTARALEGLNRNASVHAAGVVIGDKPLKEYVPLFKANDVISTQYDMKILEKIGLLKMDFLGLRTLTIIHEALRLIKETENIDVDIEGIPFDDAKTYELLCRGETFGVFQLESSGMRDILRKLKPRVFEDVAALLALYRPGPLGSGMVDDFIHRKNDGATIHYDHPLLEPILKETYGVILYQEQVMKIVSALAGFTLAQADLLRRAIGKKIPEVMEEQKKNFIDGAAKNKVKREVAEKVFNLIEYFAGYGFNKSHSVAYSFISYQTAYLKANFPLEFITATLTLEKDNTDKVVLYIEESKRLGFQILPPCVNESRSEFTCNKEKGSIRFGLSAVKNVGLTAIESIVATRVRIGDYKTLYSFTENVDLRVVNRKVLESLIKGGACDSFGLKRSQLMANVDHALEVGSKVQKDRDSGQLSFFKNFAEEEGFENSMQQIPNIDEWPEAQLLAFEKEVLGFYISSHPLAKFEKLIQAYTSINAGNLSQCADQSDVQMGGIIDSLSMKITRRGDRMCFATLQDLEGKTQVIVFPDTFKKYEPLLQVDALVFIKGKANTREDEAKLIATDIIPLSEVRMRLTKVLTLDLFTAGLEPQTLEKVRQIISHNKGNVPVCMNFREPNGKCTQLVVGEDFKVLATDRLFDDIEKVLGKNTIKVTT